MIEDFRLRVFITAAGTGSLTEAARILGITQPAVSRIISELESEYGCKLFTRHKAGVQLTGEGVLLKGCSEQIMHWYGVAKDLLSGAGQENKLVQFLPLDSETDAEIWSSMGDLHITIKKK